jgi:tRNA 5-methylaminomethyl-2-thiouridine biosynthesis bifunctional protein
VGLYAPYLSADNNFTSQITAVGVQFTQKLARQLLIQGVDWQPSGVTTRQDDEPELWHADAGWIKPAALVKACLAQPNITWCCNREVKRLAWDTGHWTLFDKDDNSIAQAKMVVIAASNQSLDLLKDVAHASKWRLQAVRGQVTYGDLNLITTLSSNQPVNGGGSYIETDAEWLIGATYDRDNLSLEPTVRDQVENFERLERLMPDIAVQLKPAVERGLVKNWVGIRCATTDRLPIVGQVMQGLWLCTAMASRGLSLAPLCAELLAAQLHDEPLPLNARLTRALGAQRYLKPSN